MKDCSKLRLIVKILAQPRRKEAVVLIMFSFPEFLLAVERVGYYLLSALASISVQVRTALHSKHLVPTSMILAILLISLIQYLRQIAGRHTRMYTSSVEKRKAAISAFMLMENEHEVLLDQDQSDTLIDLASIMGIGANL